MKQIAERLNVSVATYREWEYGRSIQNGERYVALAEVLGVGLKELMIGKTVSNDGIRAQVNEIENRLRRLKTDLEQVLDD